MDESTELDNVANFRDVGYTINKFLGHKHVREGLIYRSARPDDASSKDVAFLREGIGIATIVDLRTETELLKQAEKGHTAESEDIDWITEPRRPPRMRDVHYREIKVTGRPFERHLISQLSWLNFIKVVAFFLFGYRLDAMRVIVSQVMLPRGLLGLGTDTLDYSGAEIRETLLLYATSPLKPTLVHCTQGKDRTGLICALVLMILNVPTSAIEQDYFLTDAALAGEREERLREIRQIGLTDEWANTAPNMIKGVQGHLETKYNGLDNYLDAIGFDETLRTTLRERLLY